ncbi:hypothetical protein RFI_15495, partial [Reticulomyxa filosa]
VNDTRDDELKWMEVKWTLSNDRNQSVNVSDAISVDSWRLVAPRIDSPIYMLKRQPTLLTMDVFISKPWTDSHQCTAHYGLTGSFATWLETTMSYQWSIGLSNGETLFNKTSRNVFLSPNSDYFENARVNDRYEMKGSVTINNTFALVSKNNDTTENAKEWAALLTGMDNSTFQILQDSIVPYLSNGLYRWVPIRDNTVMSLLLDASKTANHNGEGPFPFNFSWQCEQLFINQSVDNMDEINSEIGVNITYTLSNGNNNNKQECGKKIRNYLQNNYKAMIFVPLQALDADRLYHFWVKIWDNSSNEMEATFPNSDITTQQYVIKSKAVDVELAVNYEPIVVTCHQPIQLFARLLDVLPSSDSLQWNLTYHISPPLLNGTIQNSVLLSNGSFWYQWTILPVQMLPGQTYIVKFQAVKQMIQLLVDIIFFFDLFVLFLKQVLTFQTSKKKKKKKKIGKISSKGQKAFGVLALPVMNTPVINALRVNAIATEADMYGIVWGTSNNETYTSMYNSQMPQVSGNLLVNCAQHFPCRFHYYIRISSTFPFTKEYNVPLACAHVLPQISSAILPFFGKGALNWRYQFVGCVESRFEALQCISQTLELDARPLVSSINGQSCLTSAEFIQRFVTLLINSQDTIKLAQFITKIFVELDFLHATIDRLCIRNIVRLLMNVVSEHLSTEYFEYV